VIALSLASSRLPARRLALVIGGTFLGASLAAGGAPALAHSPNPLFGSTTWNKDQIVGYQWWPGAVPPGWMATAIDLGAQDVGQSRKSHAATFTRVSAAASRIAYGVGNPCPSYGIACVDRTGVPDRFAGMWFRPHGWTFDWGNLRWCQGLLSPANGCFDAETVTLDEFGHIEILGHHVNYADERDYLDSVVQAVSRARPKEGWNEHVFGRCDVARLQLEYELPTSADLTSTCLSLATNLSIVPSATAISIGRAVRITGNFKVAAATGARALSGDPLSNRTITLQRRPVGLTTWSNVGTLAPTGAPGSYGLNITPSMTYDYRLSFAKSSAEGLLASMSSVVRIAVSACTEGPALDFGGPAVACE
jgi:hypothetical protein